MECCKIFTLWRNICIGRPISLTTNFYLGLPARIDHSQLTIPGSATHCSSADRRSGLSMDGPIITEIRVCILLVSRSPVELCNDECLVWGMIYHNSWLTGLLSPASPPRHNFQHFSSNKKQNPLWVKDLWRCSIESQSFQAVVSWYYEECEIYPRHHKNHQPTDVFRC